MPKPLWKRIVKSSLNVAGFEIRRTREVKPYSPVIRHAEVFPAATYSPWLSDEAFRKVHSVIRKNTLVDKYRCYELWQLVAETAKLTEGDLIEVGVWRGGTGALIASRSADLKIPGILYLCDTFTGVAKAGPKDGVYRGGEHADTTEQVVKDLCQELGLQNVRILAGLFPEASASSIADRRFRFCHIDVDVYESAKGIVDWVWERMVPGGMFVFDDYGSHSCSGITEFVNEERTKTDRLVIHNLNGHAIVIKRPYA